MRWQATAFAVLVCAALVAPLLVSVDPMLTDTSRQLEPPSREHIFGTDTLGRDVFSRLVFGGQRTLAIALLATGLAVSAGGCLGILAGVSGNWVDQSLSILMNALLAFPSIVFALIILTLMGSGELPLILATGFAQIVTFARVGRAAVISVRGMLYVEAAYAAGATRLYTILHTILPNIYPSLLTYAGVTFSYCLLNSAALSFLGLGGQPGIPDWGVMLAEGRSAFRPAPWIAVAPGIAISLTIWLVNSLTRYRTEIE
jgi:peptide/nickel transport system permease protein